MSKRIYLNAFDMTCVGHQSPGLWTHPEDQSYRYADLDYWTDMAKLLEKGKFDSLFLADVLGAYDVYEGSRDAAVRQSVQIPANDPLLVIPSMAQATKHLGFGVTVSVTYEHPYLLARRLSTLDHLTKGRVGWNIVTSYLDSAAKNFGFDQQIKHDQRYEIAEEYLEVCYKLWEGSWEDGAVVKDKEKKVYTDPEKVHDIEHEGKYFKVPGPHICEPSPQRTPVLYQAGASPRGRAFAVKHAECIFTAGPTVDVVKKQVDNIRKSAAEIGKDGEQVLVFSLITPIVGETEGLAQKKYEELIEYVSYEGALALLGGWTGIDFSQYEPDQVLEYVESDAIQSAVESFTKANPDKKWTVREVVNYIGLGGRGPVVVGTPVQVADELESWIREAGVDGFNIAYATSPGTMEDFVELVVPELERRGLVSDKQEGTYRENLFGKGQTHLPDNHVGKQYRKRVEAEVR